MAENDRVHPKAPGVAGIGTGTPWSPFHAALKLPARVPGTPVRQSMPPSLTTTAPASYLSMEDLRRPPLILEEFKKHFNTLDLLIEYKLLFLNCPRGIYILPSSKSLYEWHGVIFIHTGPYMSGIFRFTLYITDGFPKQRPMIRFQSKVYHPYIHRTNGVLNLLRGFPWEPNTHHIWHVVQFVYDCFHNKDTWEEEEGEEEGGGGQAFRDKAHHCAVESFKEMYSPNNDEDNWIRFKEIDDTSFKEALVTLAQGGLPKAQEKRSTVLSSVTDHVKQLWDQLVSATPT